MLRNDGTSLEIAAFPIHVSAATRPTLNPPAPQNVGAGNLSPIDKVRAESVIGEDGRVEIKDTASYPNSAIVYLEVKFPFTSGMCTGWVVGPRTIATAAHCVYSRSLGGWAKSIKAFPGRKGTLAPFGSYSGASWFVKPKWVKREKPKFDFAAINLSANIASTVGAFGFAYNDDDAFWQEYPVTVRGYPGDKPNATLWSMDGSITQIAKTRFFYPIDTYAGQSGSPVYGAWGTECDPCSFGIHTYGVGSNWTLNSGTRITGQVFNFLLSVIAQ
jgi:glutamyl endopeptidase